MGYFYYFESVELKMLSHEKAKNEISISTLKDTKW